MNIEPEHKNKKAHNNVKYWGNKDALQSPLESAAAHIRQEQNNSHYKQDSSENGQNIHKASLLFNFKLNPNSY